jgi:aldehyde:ferredoxin oxidoreductase
MPTKGQLIYDVLAKLVNARYGTDLKGEDVRNMGIKTIKEELTFNHSAGWTAAENRLPEFLSKEELPPHNGVFDVPQDEINTIFEDLN